MRRIKQRAWFSVAAMLVFCVVAGGGCAGSKKPSDAYSDDALIGAKPPGTNAIIVRQFGVGSGSFALSDGVLTCFDPNGEDYSPGQGTQVCWAYLPTSIPSVTLSATALRGSLFTGWTKGPCSGSTATTCTVPMSADRSIRARFDLAPPAIRTEFTLHVDVLGFVDGEINATASPVPAGGFNWACGAFDPGDRVNVRRTCSATFPAGTVVTLTAVPVAARSYFGGWGGACGGPGECTVAVSADARVTATFSLNHPYWSDPAVHGAKYREFEAGVPSVWPCTSCHGATLQGQGSAVSCSTCHAWPRPPITTVVVGGDATDSTTASIRQVINLVEPGVSAPFPGRACRLADGRNLIVGIDAFGRPIHISVYFPAAFGAGPQLPALELGAESTVTGMWLLALDGIVVDARTASLAESWIRSQPEFATLVALVRELIEQRGYLDPTSSAPVLARLKALVDRLAQLITVPPGVPPESDRCERLAQIGACYLPGKGIRIDWARDPDSCTSGVMTFRNPNPHWTRINFGSNAAVPIDPPRDSRRYISPKDWIPDVTVQSVASSIVEVARAWAEKNLDVLEYEITSTDVMVPGAATDVTISAIDGDRISLIMNTAEGVRHLFPSSGVVSTVVDLVDRLPEVDSAWRQYQGEPWSFVLSVSDIVRDEFKTTLADQLIGSLHSLGLDVAIDQLNDALFWPAFEVGLLKDAVYGAVLVHHVSLDGQAAVTIPVGSLFPGCSSASAPAALALSRQPSNGVSGVPLSVQPVVNVIGEAGNVVSGATTAITATSSSGVLTGTTTVVATNGVATFTDLAITGTGSFELTFSAAGLASAVSQSFAITPTSACSAAQRWLAPASGTTSELDAVASSGSRTVVAGFNGTILSSRDLASWLPGSPAQPAANVYMDAAYDPAGVFVAVGTNGWGTHFGAIISTSLDGTSWTARASAVTPGLNGIAYGNGTFVAVGNLGALQRSSDGIAATWVAVSSGTTEHLDGVRFLNGRFVAVGHSGTVMTSLDGRSWTTTSAGAGNLLSGIAFGNGRYVAVGGPMSGVGAAKILTSTDLVNWTDVSPALTPTWLKRVEFANGVFVAAGTGIVVSTDGNTWTPQTTPPAGGYSGGAVGVFGTRFVVAGTGGTILTASAGSLNCTQWSATASMKTARGAHTATLLPSGKVLVTGGRGNPAWVLLGSTELYDPTTRTWSDAADLLTPRMDHSATLLQTGEVLVVGGGIATAELYNPTTNTWRATGSLSTARRHHTATLLPSGHVLVAGGGVATAEVYDPSSGSWSPTGSMASVRADHTATLLNTGEVLVAGGYWFPVALSSAELYNPATGTWRTAGSFTAAARLKHTATLLASGRVLIAGGEGAYGDPQVSAALYDPTSGTWVATGSTFQARTAHTATLLPSGRIVVMGWATFGDDAETFDPNSGYWAAAGEPAFSRNAHTATLLPSGDVLVAGGFGSDALASAELLTVY